MKFFVLNDKKKQHFLSYSFNHEVYLHLIGSFVLVGIVLLLFKCIILYDTNKKKREKKVPSVNVTPDRRGYVRDAIRNRKKNNQLSFSFHVDTACPRE